MADRIEGHGAFVRIQGLPGRLFGVAGALECSILRLCNSCGLDLRAISCEMPLLPTVEAAGKPGISRWKLTGSPPYYTQPASLPPASTAPPCPNSTATAATTASATTASPLGHLGEC